MDQATLNSVIIDSNNVKRMQLKQATTSLAMFKATQQSTDPAEAIAKFELGQALDIVFIANRFTEEQIKTFINTAKTKNAFKDTAFILVFESKGAEDNAKMPQYMILGIDGFLLEPYSVDKLIETSKIASRVKKDRALQRKRVAVELLISEISSTFNALASFKTADITSTKIEEKFKKAADTITTLDGEGLEYFQKRIVDLWSNLEAPEKTVELPKYKGASSRIKKILEEKVLEQLNKVKDAS